MGQSKRITVCAICGKKLGEWAWLHSDGVQVRSELEENMTIVHKECVALVKKAMDTRDTLYLALIND